MVKKVRNPSRHRKDLSFIEITNAKLHNELLKPIGENLDKINALKRQVRSESRKFKAKRLRPLADFTFKKYQLMMQRAAHGRQHMIPIKRLAMHMERYAVLVDRIDENLIDALDLLRHITVVIADVEREYIRQTLFPEKKSAENNHRRRK